MNALLTMSPQSMAAQLLIGLINGSFYALLSLGLAIIFGLLNIINFAHGALYMLGAFVAWIGLTQFGTWIGMPELSVNYWIALVVAPLVVAAFSVIVERTMLRRLYKLDHLYGLLFTFGLALVLEGLFTHWYGAAGQSYNVPPSLAGPVRIEALGIVLPRYRLWVVAASLVVCFGTWWTIERTRLGAYLRAGTENPRLMTAFGVNVPLMITLTYAFGVFLAGFAGVLAAPIFQVSPLMGSNLIIVVFAVVVIGGMGSIGGSIVTGLGLGLVEGLSKVVYPEASAVVIFVIMAIVLMIKPAGLFGKDAGTVTRSPMSGVSAADRSGGGRPGRRRATIAFVVLVGIAALMPFQHAIYLVFLMKILCFALFACAFNLLLGYGGLLSFGHAAFFGSAAYATAHVCKVLGAGPATGIVAGVVTATLIAAVVGAIAIRRQGIYFAMVTLALAQLLYFVAIQVPLTGGEDGIQNVPRGTLFGVLDLSSDTAMYYVVLAVFVAGFAIVHRTIHSPFGKVLQAIRENEPRAISLGYDVNRYKLLVFVLSAALSGLAGATKAVVFQLASLADVHWHGSGEVILMTLLGGVGTVLGPVVGATVVVVLQTLLASAGSWATVIVGGVFMACVLLFRRGLVGELGPAIRRRLRGVEPGGA